MFGDAMILPTEELESRFHDLRKLYYHTKEQKQKALDKVRELEGSLAARDARIRELEAQVHSGAADAPPPARRSSGAAQTARVAKENEELRVKLRTLQDWAANIRPPPAHCMLPAP